MGGDGRGTVMRWAQTGGARGEGVKGEKRRISPIIVGCDRYLGWVMGMC